MKILWLTENYPPQKGGMSESCDRIIEGLKHKGFEIHIIHFYRKGKPFKTMSKENGSYTYIPVSTSKAHTLNQAAIFLENNFQKKTDVLIGWGGNVVKDGIYVLHKLLNLPYYFCFRGNDFDISLFNGKDAFGLEQLIVNAKGIFTNSTDKIRKIKAIYNYEKAYFTPNSIDLNSWRTTPLEIESAIKFRSNFSNKKIIGLFGFIKEKKGFTFFLNALRKSRAVDQVVFLFTGEISESDMLLLKEVGVEYVQLENVARYELIPYYLYCDWVTIPSFYEGMPNVLLEAGGLKIPVLCSTADGMKDVIRDNENGLIFENLNEEACMNAIRKAVNLDAITSNKLSNALYDEIRFEYTLQNEIDSFSKHLLQ